VPPIVIEIVGDERSYLRAAENTLATNTKLDASFKQVGVSSSLSADAQIKAAVRARSALQANLTALQGRAASLPAGSAEQLAATSLAADAERKLARSYGVTTREGERLSGSSRTLERDLGKASRGALAGSGVFRGLGRSLAFASSGYLAFAGVSGLLRNSIDGAEALEKAQRGLDVAIEHTHGNLAVLKPEYAATAAGARRFGIDEATATTELERATVITGDATKARRAYTEALVISKATGKDFNAVLTATAKGQEGVTTSLQRYGILIKKDTPGQQQYLTVMSRFQGQARANTSEGERFNATLHNSEEIIGTGILPVVNKYLGELDSWLNRMNRSGRLQKEVNHDVQVAAHVIHDLGHIVAIAAGAIRGIDRVTGSFAHTLEILLALRVASKFQSWVGGLGGVASQAEGATGKLGKLRGALGSLAGLAVVATVEVDVLENIKNKVFGLQKLQQSAAANAPQYGDLYKHVADEILRMEKHGAKPKEIAERLYKEYGGQGAGQEKLVAEAFEYLNTQRGQKATGYLKQYLDEQAKRRRQHGGTRTLDTTGGTFPNTFAVPYALRLAEAKAGATATRKDDLAVAREIRAYVLKVIPHLHGDALISAYSELGTVNQEIATDLHNAVKTAKKAREFSVPAALQLAEARAQALGLPDTNILLKMRTAAERALKSGKLSAQGQIDAWNEMASLNQQLGASATSALGSFKEANTRKLTAGLGLTAKQTAELRARLSQLGPGRTVPGNGVGAFGYDIGRDGRPLVIHTHVHMDKDKVGTAVTKVQQKRRNRNSSQRRGPNSGG
jgi:hypothetical protein